MKNMKQFTVRILKIYASFKWPMLGVFGFIGAAQILNLLSPFLQGKMIDFVVSGKPIKQTVFVAIAVFAAYLLQMGIHFFRERFELNHIDFALDRHTSKITMEKVLSFSIGQHINENSGIKQSVISRGEQSLKSMAYTMLYDVLPMFVEVVLMIGALLYLNLAMGLVVLTGIMLFSIVVVGMNVWLRADMKKSEEMQNENDRWRGEVLENAELVITNAQEKRAVEDCDKATGKVAAFAVKTWLKYVNAAIFRDFIIGTTRFAVILIGIYYVYRGMYTPGYLVVFWSWSNNALGRAADISSIQRRLMSMYASVKKYFEMMDVESDIKSPANPIRPEKFNGRIEFRNVTMRYKGRAYIKDDEIVHELKTDAETQPALVNVSFVIKPGEKVAIVGESGAGKSTLVHALLRAQDPDAGQILIDGYDLKTLDLHQYRGAMGLVEQYVPLFDHSLRYNIAFGLNGRGAFIDDVQLNEIAKMTSIDRFLSRLEKGYDTIIGESGVKLSGGERQRVGIARALIKDPDILIFDEATSNLDAENEALIRESIEKASRGRTTIIIAHRFSTIRDADKIIVLDKGQVVGQGTHDELVATCEPYERLLKHQLVI